MAGPERHDIFENPTLVSENKENERLLRASQRELEIKAEGENEFLLEQVCSYYLLPSSFSGSVPTPVDCFNIRVGDALKKFPDLAEQAIRAEIQQMVSRGVFEPINVSEIPSGQKF